MSTRTGNDLLIRVDTLAQLFNAPPAIPFSGKPAVVCGEAALLHVVRQGLGQGLRDWQGRWLIIQLPPDQISLRSFATKVIIIQAEPSSVDRSGLQT